MMQGSTTQSTRVPGDLRSPRTKLVYLYLSTHEGATLDELQENLEMKKITLYSVLKTLRKRGIVEEESDRYVLV